MSLDRFVSLMKEWLWPPRQDLQEVSRYSNLEPIEVRTVATELHLKEEAQRLGKGGVPLASATILTGPEQAAINEVELARLGYQTWATRRLAAINSSITAYDIRHEIERALNLTDIFEAKAANLLTEDSAEIRSLDENQKQRGTELRLFRQANELERLADYPTASRKFLYYVILCAVVLVESLLNGALFQRGLQGGLLAGIVWAFAFAFLNVAIAFLIGRYPFRYMFHRDLTKRLFGWLSGTVALVICATLGLLLGHLRFALGSQNDDPFEYALTTFTAAPLSFGSIDSLLLFGVTITFGLIAFFDGLKMDDLYPGYGPLDRNYREAKRQYDEELEGIYEELRNLKDECIAELDKTVSSCQGATAGLNRQIIEKTTSAQRLSAALNASEIAAETLIGIFRTENTLANPERDFPNYFNSKPILKEISLHSFDVAPDRKVADEQEKLVTLLIGRSPQIRRNIETSFNMKYDKLQPLRIQLGLEV